MPASDPIGEIRRAFDASAADLLDGGALNTPVSLEQPPRPELGDYSSNAAMLLAAPLARAPRELGDDLGRAEVAGPGFVNLHLSDRWFRRALAGLARGAGTRIPPVEAQEQVI